MKSILLADDNPDLRSALRLLLETRRTAETITEAMDTPGLIRLVNQTPPDCIIIDWELPGASGKTNLEALHQIPGAIKILVTSSHPEVEQAALQAGADAFLCKSESPVRVLEILKKFN